MSKSEPISLDLNYNRVWLDGYVVSLDRMW
jgi:hypothetical protein